MFLPFMRDMSWLRCLGVSVSMLACSPMIADHTGMSKEFDIERVTELLRDLREAQSERFMSFSRDENSVAGGVTTC